MILVQKTREVSNMKDYQLIVFGSAWDVYEHSFREMIDNPRCVYMRPFSAIGIKGYIQRVLFNPRWSHLIPLAWKTYWTSFYVQDLDKNGAYCFLILENWLRLERYTRLLPYLRDTFPNAHIVCYLQDLIERTCDLYTHQHIDIDLIKQQSDLVLSYDKNDVARYTLTYAPTVYSDIDTQYESISEKYALCFIGRDKGRLPLLVSICRRMTSLGKHCAFYVLQVPKDKQIVQNGIYYIDKPLSYEQNIQVIRQSKCLLELLQPKAQSETFRTWEAIIMNKKLLTNNTSIIQSAWYDPSYISIFEDEKDIDWQFVDSTVLPWAQNPYKALILPSNLVHNIENTLHIHINY